MKAKTAFILPDQHYAPPGDKAGGVDERAESCALQAIAIVKPNIFVNIGDIIEAESISHHRYKKVRRPPLEFQLPPFEAEIAAGNAGLDRFDRALDKVKCDARYITGGNHDWVWMNDFVTMYPYLANKYSPDAAFRTKERGYKTFEYGKRLKLGDLFLYHGGLITGVNVEQKHALLWGANVMFGHHHHVGHAAVGHLDGVHGAWCIGTLCKLDKPFLQNRPTQWQHACAVVHFESDGKFHVEIIDFFDGVGYVYGKRIEAR